jgi:hypothetical protein
MSASSAIVDLEKIQLMVTIAAKCNRAMAGSSQNGTAAGLIA